MRESTIRKKCVEILRKRGYIIYDVDTNGLPDIFCHAPGEQFWIEFKAPGGQLSALQKLRISEMQRNGVNVYVVRSVEEIERYPPWVRVCQESELVGFGGGGEKMIDLNEYHLRQFNYQMGLQVGALIKALGMHWENEERKRQGQPLKYGDGDFLKLYNENSFVLTHNGILSDWQNSI